MVGMWDEIQIHQRMKNNKVHFAAEGSRVGLVALAPTLSHVTLTVSVTCRDTTPRNIYFWKLRKPPQQQSPKRPHYISWRSNPSLEKLMKDTVDVGSPYIFEA